MEALRPFLPTSEGILPYYMLLLSGLSIGNCIQGYMTLHYSRRVYNGRFVRNPKLPPASGTYDPEDSTAKLVPATDAKSQGTDQVSPLGSRLFSTWTFLACIVRCYAAYHLHHGPVYDMAVWTYVIAFFHFSSELFYFRSMTFGLPQFFPFLLSTCALIWMPSVREYYVTIN